MKYPNLITRLICFFPHLALSIILNVVKGLFVSIQWLKYGSIEIVFTENSITFNELVKAINFYNENKKETKI